jgi:hypothetical protein
MQDDQDTESTTDLPRWSGLVCAAFGLPLISIGDHWGYPDKGAAAGLSVRVLALTAWMYWPSRRHWWFWSIFLVAALLHVGLVWTIRFHLSHGPYFGYFFPPAILDFVILATALSSAKRWSPALHRGSI